MAEIKEGQRAGSGCVITLFSIGVLLPALLGLIAVTGDDRLWMMLRYYILVFPLALASFLTGFFWKPFIGGLLLIVTGLITMAGPFIVTGLITIFVTVDTTGLDLDALYLFPLAAFIGLVLLISGYSFITSRKVR